MHQDYFCQQGPQERGSPWTETQLPRLPAPSYSHTLVSSRSPWSSIGSLVRFRPFAPQNIEYPCRVSEAPCK